MARVARGFLALAAAALLAGGVWLVVYSQGDDPYFGGQDISRWEWGGTAGKPTLGIAMALTGAAVLLLIAAWKRASGFLVRLAVVVGLSAAAAQVVAGGALSIGH